MIRSKEVKKELVRLQRQYEYIEWVQNNFIKALDENFFPMMLDKVDMLTGTINDPSYLYSTINRNYIGFAISDTRSHINEYKRASKQIQKLLAMMEAIR